MERYDGSPAPAGTQILIETDKSIPSQTLTIGEDGTVTSSVDIPSDMDYFGMEIKADDAEDERFAYRTTHVVQKESFLEIIILTPK